MILTDMEKRQISLKTRYKYHQLGFGCHYKIGAVITLFQCKYHFPNIQCAKTHFSFSNDDFAHVIVLTADASVLDVS